MLINRIALWNSYYTFASDVECNIAREFQRQCNYTYSINYAGFAKTTYYTSWQYPLYSLPGKWLKKFTKKGDENNLDNNFATTIYLNRWTRQFSPVQGIRNLRKTTIAKKKKKRIAPCIFSKRKSISMVHFAWVTCRRNRLLPSWNQVEDNSAIESSSVARLPESPFNEYKLARRIFLIQPTWQFRTSQCGRKRKISFIFFIFFDIE